MDELIAGGGKKIKKKETKWQKDTREGKIDSSSSEQQPTDWPVFDPEPDSDLMLNNQNLNDSKGGLLYKMTLTHR
jgi:hypothetical protein